MLPERIAVLGADKRLSASIAKRIAKATGLEYMDLDGYIRYSLGGLTPYQVLRRSDADYLRRRIRDCIEDAASFEGVVIAACPLIFTVGADMLTCSCMCFMSEGSYDDIGSDVSLMLRIADRAVIENNIEAARAASIPLRRGRDGYAEEIGKVLEVLING
ncbi:MAG: hypothetical protein K2M44_03030 [Clostridia bacterium]|nr:hypothetical protein [Clostridia bacterium]